MGLSGSPLICLLLTRVERNTRKGRGRDRSSLGKEEQTETGKEGLSEAGKARRQAGTGMPRPEVPQYFYKSRQEC